MPPHGSRRAVLRATHALSLKASRPSATDELREVMAQMRATPFNDFFAKERQDPHRRARRVHDMYLFEVKEAPTEIQGERGTSTS